MAISLFFPLFVHVYKHVYSNSYVFMITVYHQLLISIPQFHRKCFIPECLIWHVTVCRPLKLFIYHLVPYINFEDYQHVDFGEKCHRENKYVCVYVFVRPSYHSFYYVVMTLLSSLVKFLGPQQLLEC